MLYRLMIAMMLQTLLPRYKQSQMTNSLLCELAVKGQSYGSASTSGDCLSYCSDIFWSICFLCKENVPIQLQHNSNAYTMAKIKTLVASDWFICLQNNLYLFILCLLISLLYRFSPYLNCFHSWAATFGVKIRDNVEVSKPAVSYYPLEHPEV